MANPEGGGVNRTIDDGNAVVNSGSAANLHDPDPASDTEQHGGVDISGQKLGAGKKKACFQITQVLPVSKAANNDGNMDDPDSNDEQDESHADDFSSSERIDSFNMSKCSIPDLDHSLDDGSSFDPVVAPSSIPAPSGSAEEQTNNVTSNATQANGNGPHRFKVVRVASEPIRKGRWICRDFPSESSNVKTTNQTTPDSLRNQDPSKETLHSGNSSAASSVHYVHGQDNNSDNPLTMVDESGKPSDLGRKMSSTSTKDSENRINPKAIQEDQKDDKLRLVEQLKDELDLQEHSSESTEGDEGTSPAGGAIDNKIEQAMDLVKSHLLFAVREEVEVLKEQIKILEAKNELLQEENSALKKRLTQTSTAPANMAMAPPPQSSHQHQGMPMQQPNQEPQPYPSMPNQMGQASLGQAQMGQAMSDHAAYPQHPRTTQQTHSAPNPGGLPEPAAQYTPQTSVESQGQYHVHSQRHIQTGQAPQQGLQQGIQDMTQYSQVAGGVATAPPQSQGQYHPNH